MNTKRAHNEHHAMKVRFEKNRQRLRRTIYWKPQTLENGMRLADLEGRSFNNWLESIVADKWLALEKKRERERRGVMA